MTATQQVRSETRVGNGGQLNVVHGFKAIFRFSSVRASLPTDSKLRNYSELPVQ